MHGSDVLAYREFSGFDFARLIRNFEITDSSAPSLSPLQVTAIALYLGPGLAVNAAIMHQIARTGVVPRRVASLAMIFGGIYVLAVLALLLVLSLVSLNQFARVVGAPQYGFLLTLCGALLLLVLGARELKNRGEPNASITERSLE